MTSQACRVPTIPIEQPLSVSAFGRTWLMTSVFGPLWWPDGTLAALELLSRFTDTVSGVKVSPERLFSQAPRDVQLRMLHWQITLLTELAPWCLYRQVPISLNLTRSLATMVLAESGIDQALRALSPCLRLEITEYFLNPDVPPGRDPLLRHLRSLAPLWLDDFGTGTAGFSGLLTGMFEAVKVDRLLFCDLVVQSGGLRFLQSLTGLAAGLGTQVIVEGVEDISLLQAAKDAGVSACQGWLWREVTQTDLITLPDRLQLKEYTS